MQSLQHVTSLAQVIQLAVAPVFLLAGVGATLNVLASRIGRIIDRARAMEVAFVVALLSLAAALLLFLREVFIATESLTFGNVRRASQHGAARSPGDDVAKE